jgi:hypothetical protein
LNASYLLEGTLTPEHATARFRIHTHWGTECFGFIFAGLIGVRGTPVLSRACLCLCIHHPVTVDEGTIIVALLCKEEEK